MVNQKKGQVIERNESVVVTMVTVYRLVAMHDEMTSSPYSSDDQCHLLLVTPCLESLCTPLFKGESYGVRWRGWRGWGKRRIGGILRTEEAKELWEDECSIPCQVDSRRGNMGFFPHQRGPCGFMCQTGRILAVLSPWDMIS